MSYILSGNPMTHDVSQMYSLCSRKEQAHPRGHHVVQPSELCPPKPGLLTCGGICGRPEWDATGEWLRCQEQERILLDPSPKIHCLVPVVTTDPSDIHHTRTLFLGLRKEWQGFKNKVLDTGGKYIQETWSWPGNATHGPANIRRRKGQYQWLSM